MGTRKVHSDAVDLHRNGGHPTSQVYQGTVHNSRNILAMYINETVCLKQYDKHTEKEYVVQEMQPSYSKILFFNIFFLCALLKVQKVSPLLFK